MKIKNWFINAINDNFIGYIHKSGNIVIYAEMDTDIDYKEYSGTWTISAYRCLPKKGIVKYFIKNKIIQAGRYGSKVRQLIVDWIKNHPFDNEPMTQEFWYVIKRGNNDGYWCHLCNNVVYEKKHIKKGKHISQQLQIKVIQN